MSTHPNVILMACLTPDALARKTYRDIFADNNIAADDDCPEVKVGSTSYHIQVMESDYDDSYQISAKEGDIVLHNLVTYGYGETITWLILTDKARELDEWCVAACAKHHCKHEIKVGANYW